MKCRSCKREIEDKSVFCNWCGARQVREKKKRDDITIPAARQLKSGAWNIELRAEHQSVTEPTKALAEAKARAIRAGFIEKRKASPKQTLSDIVEKYIADNEAVLSPATVRSYETMLRSRFKGYMQRDASEINYQEMISVETKTSAPKTVYNGWRMVTAAFNYAGLDVPKVNLPQKTQKETAWLDYEQIQKFIKAIEGKSCELACLLALHSLRISEIRALTAESITGGVIHIRGAVVPDKYNKLVKKPTNKNDPSRRDVQIMIPRLTEILPASGELKIPAQSPLYRQIKRTCEKNNLPAVTIHGLRHSFASLAYHLKWDELTTCAVGGWADPTCVHRIYTHLSRLDKNDNIERMRQFYSDEFTNEITNEI